VSDESRGNLLSGRVSPGAASLAADRAVTSERAANHLPIATDAAAAAAAVDLMAATTRGIGAAVAPGYYIPLLFNACYSIHYSSAATSRRHCMFQSSYSSP